MRQFEFAQNVWINDPNFHELGNERDPIIGNQDGTFDLTISESPDPQKDHGPTGLHDAQRRCIFLPSEHEGAASPCWPIGIQDFWFWPEADMKRCPRLRLLSGVKRTRGVSFEDFRF